MELLPSFIKAPRSARYLNDFMPDGLPTNCLFDKVTTGCGGTYVALMCAKPYIVAVPTKALVKDKVENPIYAAKGLIGISEDYPLRQEIHYFSSDKLIVTYKSLPELCDRLDISRYNLLIDEAHMLTNMTTYARKELRWILENFRFFKSYCFMSATIPRSSHLLPEIAPLNRVYIDWPKVQAVNFECYLTTNTVNTVLQIIYEHYVQKRPGTPYFFYNSVTGICSLYDKNPKECGEKFPEWIPIIETLGTLTICNLGYSKTEAKLLFESRTKGSSAIEVETLHSLLKIGQAYTKEQLTEVFAEAGAPKAKVSCLKQWFEIRNTKVNGKSAYRIIRKL